MCNNYSDCVESHLLQDHFRKIVKPAYTNVFRDRGQIIGVVEFENEDDLEYAIRCVDVSGALPRFHV